MRILIVGSGARENALRQMALAAGHSLPEFGPWDQAVLSLPKSSIDENTSDQLPRGQNVICGITDEAFESLAQKRGWKLHRVLEDSIYTKDNALLTAEGAIHSAGDYYPKALREATCLVIGCGRIGMELIRMLRALHIRTIAAARRKESREAAGEPSVAMEALSSVLPCADIIFNTVPAMILNKERLQSVKEDCLLLELASKPYGIDFKAAEELGLSLHLESGLPGRYCPVSAAKTLLNYMEREANHE